MNNVNEDTLDKEPNEKVQTDDTSCDGKSSECEKKDACSDGAKGEKKCKKENAELKKELAAAKERVDKAERQLADQTDKYLRTVAEYDNFRKRSAKEKEGIYADAYADVIAAILPVIDNLERAVAFSDGSQTAEGVKMTLDQFAATLEKLGIEIIPTEKFDPNLHNAVMHIEDESFGEGAIVEVFQKGYRKGDKIIRYAMVKVAN